MSQYTVVECEIENPDDIVEGLKALGVQEDEIEVHEEAQPLIGYKGKQRAEKGHVIVRRPTINKRFSGGASNDLGFQIADGHTNIQVSEFDKRWWDPLQEKFKNEATCSKVVSAIKKQRDLKGYEINRSQDGQIEITLQRTK